MAAGFTEVVGPGIAMGVEMDDGQRPAEPGAVGPQQGQGDGVVTADPGHVVRADQPLDQRAHGSTHAFEAGVGQRKVACVTQMRFGAQVEVGVGAIAQHVAGFANGARPEACAGAVGDAAVPRNAGHGVGGLRISRRCPQKTGVGQEGK